MLALPKLHPLATTKTLKLDQVQDTPLIARKYCPHYQDLLEVLTEDALSLTTSAEAVHDQQVLELVRSGFGGAILPAGHVALDETLSGVPITHTPLTERKIGLAVRKTAAADEMFQIWMTGFNPRSPCL